MVPLLVQERAAAEEQWQKQAMQIEAAAEKSKQATEAKVGSIINRLHSLAEKENNRESQRGMLTLKFVSCRPGFSILIDWC